MRRYDLEIKRIKKKYDAQLHQIYKENQVGVLCFTWFNKINRSNITNLRREQLINDAKEIFGLKPLTNQDFMKFLLDNSNKVKQILSDFEVEFLNYCKSQNLKLNYVTNSKVDVIKPSLYETKYNQNLGNCVVASSEELSKLISAIKLSEKDLLKIGENILLLQNIDNIVIGENNLKLKKPVYSYKLNIDDFEPVLSVKVYNHVPTILFDDEWISKKSYTTTFNELEEIIDITDLLKYFKIFVFTGNLDEKSLNILQKLNKATKREAEKTLNKLLWSNKVVLLNENIISNNDELSKN